MATSFIGPGTGRVSQAGRFHCPLTHAGTGGTMFGVRAGARVIWTSSSASQYQIA